MSNPMLHGIPRVCIESEKTFFWKYQPLGVECLSTVEAIYHLCRQMHMWETSKDNSNEASMETNGTNNGSTCEGMQQRQGETALSYDGRYDDLLYYFCLAHQRTASFYQHRTDLLPPVSWTLRQQAAPPTGAETSGTTTSDEKVSNKVHN